MMNVGAVAITVDVDAAKALARIEELKARLGNLRKSFKDITGESKETAQALKLQADLQARLASEAEKARAAMAGGFAALGEVKRSAEQVAPQLSRMSQLFAEMRTRVLGVGQALKSVDWKGEIGKSKETLEKQAGAIAALTMAFGAQDTKVGQVIRSVGGMAAAYGSMGPLGVALAATATAVNLLDEHYASVLAKQDEMIAKSHAASLKALDSTKEVRDLSKQVLSELSSVGLTETEKRVSGINKMIAAQQAELDTLVREHSGLGWDDDKQRAKETYQTNIKHLQDQALHVQLLGKAVEDQARIDEAKRKREAEAQAYDAELRERLLQATGKLNKEQERSLRISAEVLRQVPTATRAEMDSWNQSGNALEGAPVVWRQFDEVTQAQLDRETGVDNGLNGPVVWDWDKSQANADAARAYQDGKAFSDMRMGDARASIGESFAGGGLAGLDANALGSALGAAAGVPIAGAVIGVVSTIGSLIGTAVSGTIGKLLESKGAQGFFEAAGTAAAGVAAALLLLTLALAVAGPVLLLALAPVVLLLGGLAIVLWPVTLAFLALAAVLAPLVILGGGLVVFMAALGTQTKQFANIQMVIGRAFEALALPLGGFWQALEPLAGAMMQGANAFSQILAPLAPLLAAFVGLDKVTWFLVSTIATLGKFISGVIATLARALDDLIDLIELVTGTDIKGEKGLKNIAAGADIAYGQFDAITVDSGQQTYTDMVNATEDNTAAIKDMTASLTNIPSGYRVEGAMFDSQTPERRGGSGGNARHRNAGDARMARGGGGTVIIKNLTVQARNRRILDEIGDEVRRRYGTDRMPTGPLDDDG